jgi:hypothetical protein
MAEGLKLMGQLRIQKEGMRTALSNARNLEQELAMLEAQMVDAEVRDEPADGSGNTRPCAEAPRGLLERMLRRASESGMPSG